MKVVQFFLPGKGKRVGLVHEDRLTDVTSSDEGVSSSLDLIVQGKTAQGLVTRAMWLAKRLRRRDLDWREIQRRPSRRVAHLLVPVDAPEVWVASDAADRPTDGRPALFFKATASRLAGPHAPIGIRADSALTVPQASLAAVFGSGGEVVAYTACNDLTARDIEREGPEYVGQAKIYLGSCALGPCLVTPDGIGDAYALQVRCTVERGDATIFSEAANTVRLRRTVGALSEWVRRDNAIPPGAVLAAGVGIAVPDAMALADADCVHIEIQGIGRLTNPVRRHGGLAGR